MMAKIKTALEWLTFITVLIVVAHIFSAMDSANCPENDHGTVSSD